MAKGPCEITSAVVYMMHEVFQDQHHGEGRKLSLVAADATCRRIDFINGKVLDIA